MTQGNTIDRERVARFLEKRAAAIEDARHLGRIQPHSGALPTEIELAEAAFAARQLRIAADEIRAGMEKS